MPAPAEPELVDPGLATERPLPRAARPRPGRRIRGKQAAVAAAGEAAAVGTGTDIHTCILAAIAAQAPPIRGSRGTVEEPPQGCVHLSTQSHVLK